MTFIRRQLEFLLSYGTGDKGNGPPRLISLKGHRASVSVRADGEMGMGSMQARIYGMTFPMMNDVTTIGALPTLFRKNSVIVAAGDAKSGMAKIFEGTITAAWADMAPAPEVAFHISSGAGVIQSLLPVEATTFNRTVDAAEAMSTLSQKAGLKFINHGVKGFTFSPCYFWGSARDQLVQCAQAGRAYFVWWLENETVEIWPAGGYRNPDATVPLISVDTGMVGYPSYTATGVMVKTLFNPDIRFGALVEVKSSFQNSLGQSPANGKYRVSALRHELEAETPGGQWFSTLILTVPEVFLVVR